MSKAQVKAPKFQFAFLLPKYWLIWLSMGILYFISWLPFVIQLQIGKLFGKLLGVLAKNRVAVAKRNLELCFPEKTEQEIHALVKENIEHAGMAILETGMGWWWPDWRIKSIGHFEGYEHIEAILAKGKGVLALAIHNMNIELGCRITGVKKPSVAFYRKHNNPFMEYIQYHGRARSNKYMIDKRNARGLIEALNQQELGYYFPDQDYGRGQSEFVPFFAVEDAASTKGTLLFAKRANCETVFMMSMRTKQGYHIKVVPGLKDFPSGDDKQDIARINKQVEELLKIAPAQYLWMHKRFKTRPTDSDPSYY